MIFRPSLTYTFTSAAGFCLKYTKRYAISTAFLDFAAFKSFLAEIAWETEVWAAEAPSHLLHFDGERFLGPYNKASSPNSK